MFRSYFKMDFGVQFLIVQYLGISFVVIWNNWPLYYGQICDINVQSADGTCCQSLLDAFEMWIMEKIRWMERTIN